MGYCVALDFIEVQDDKLAFSVWIEWSFLAGKTDIFYYKVGICNTYFVIPT